MTDTTAKAPVAKGTDTAVELEPWTVNVRDNPGKPTSSSNRLDYCNASIRMTKSFYFLNLSYCEHKWKFEFNQYNEIYFADMVTEINMGAISPRGKRILPHDLYINGKFFMSYI